MVDLVINLGVKREVEEWEDDLPKDFLMDCLSTAAENIIVPFQRANVAEWLENKRSRICREDHLHHGAWGWSNTTGVIASMMIMRTRRELRTMSYYNRWSARVENAWRLSRA